MNDHTVQPLPYFVLVDDNYHYMDASARFTHGAFATLQEAVTACQRIVDEYLVSAYQLGMSAASRRSRHGTTPKHAPSRCVLPIHRPDDVASDQRPPPSLVSLRPIRDDKDLRAAHDARRISCKRICGTRCW